MQIRPRLEAVIDDMLDGRILLSEALDEFEKQYIQKAYTRNRKRISHTAEPHHPHPRLSVRTACRDHRPLGR